MMPTGMSRSSTAGRPLTLRVSMADNGEAAFDDYYMSLEKLVKKWFKHVLWIGVAMWTGFTFVGYFTPIKELGMPMYA